MFCSSCLSNRVDKLFLQSSELGLPPPPHTHGRVCTVYPPFGSGGGGAHSLAGKGVGESQLGRGGQTLWHCGTLGIYVLFGLSSFTYLPNTVLKSRNGTTKDVNIFSYKKGKIVSIKSPASICLLQRLQSMSSDSEYIRICQV
jgi:hypothetical protein